MDTTAGLYARLPRFSRFGDLVDNGGFTPLPDDWTIGLTDIEASTAAIQAGQYKMVNSAGAAVISAVSNALGHLDFPFIFGGDGAAFAVAPEAAERARTALASTVAWVARELGLTLRGGAVTVGEIRAAGLDVRVARFAASHNVTYAMFAGGGLAWAERKLKAGEISVAPAPEEAKPDLTGLSCRFENHRAKHGTILSVLVRPTGEVHDPAFQALLVSLLVSIEAAPDMSRPNPMFRPLGALRFQANWLQARLHRKPGGSRLWSYLRSVLESLGAMLFFGSGATIRGVSAKRYLREVVENSDFRKFDDGLMMTLDCSEGLAGEIEARLRQAEAVGVALFGLHRQAAATVTCVVPSAARPNHVHFIDGASGGYAMAARALKLRQAAAPPGSTVPARALASGPSL